MKTHITALLVLVFLVGGIVTACMTDAGTRESPHMVATPLGRDLVGKRNERIYWVYESEVDLSPEDTPFISFGAEGFGGEGQCSGYGVIYTYAPDGKIELGDVVERGPGCSEENQALQSQFVDIMRVVNSITRVDDKLYLEGPAGQLVFRPLRADDTNVIPSRWNSTLPLPWPTPRPYPHSMPVEPTLLPPLIVSPYP